MKYLEYKVAWIDDQPEKAQGYYSQINNRLGKQGFSLLVDWVNTGEDLDAFIKNLQFSSHYDVIMVDWKLGKMTDGTSGAAISQQIRARQSFSTILFYSAEEPVKLRGEIARLLIDGVFCVNRTHFVEEAMRVIKSTLNRYADLTMMRGLFLASVSEFDEIIRDSSIKSYLGLPEDRKKLITQALLESSSSYLDVQKGRLYKLDPASDLIGLIKGLRPSSKQLVDCLIQIMSLDETSSAHVEALSKLKSYEAEVLVPRNDMAHLQEKEKDGIRCLSRQDRQWDPTKFEQLRVCLKEHFDNLSYIKTALLDEMISRIVKAETKETTDSN